MTPPSSFLGVSKCKGTKVNSAVLASPSTSSSQKVVEYPSATDILALLSSDEEKVEDDRGIDIAATLVERNPRLSKRDYFELDNHSFEDEEDKSLSVNALQYTRKSSTDSKAITGAEVQHTNSNRTDALHHNVGKNESWLSTQRRRPRYDNIQESSELHIPEAKLLLAEQGEWLDACIDECSRQVDAMIAEGIDALASQMSHQGELLFELTSEDMPDHDGLTEAATLCRGWTSTQSDLIRDIESLLG